MSRQHPQLVMNADVAQLGSATGCACRGDLHMAALDSLADCHKLHALAERAEASPLRSMSQTIIARLQAD